MLSFRLSDTIPVAVADSTVVLLNPSGIKANLDLTITGDTKLGMTYEPVQEYGKSAPK